MMYITYDHVPRLSSAASIQESIGEIKL
jgi:hypothetical protein